MDTIALDGQRSPLYQNADFDEKKTRKTLLCTIIRSPISKL